MAAIHDLLAQVQDQELRERIEKEIDKLSKTKKFGLVFEEHLPECTPLYDVKIKRGSTVAKKSGSINDVYDVLKIRESTATCINRVSQVVEDIDIDDLIAVAQFGEPIYPYLKPINSVCNAPDSDLWHTLIEADNYHALQLLEYLYAGKVDCIYIDPPYNTGARDWKYNNDYVDGADAYRHPEHLCQVLFLPGRHRAHDSRFPAAHIQILDPECRHRALHLADRLTICGWQRRRGMRV